MLWFRIGFNADPDPAFYLMWIRIRIQIHSTAHVVVNPLLITSVVDPHRLPCGSGNGSSRIRVRILVRLSSHKKLNFYMNNNILKVGNRSFSIRIRIQGSQMNADPGGSGSTKLLIIVAEFCCLVMEIANQEDSHFFFSESTFYDKNRTCPC